MRDKESWLRSCRQHWERFQFVGPEPDEAPFWRRFAEWMNSVVYGSHRFDADRWSWVYDRHIENVQTYFRGRSNDLLVLDLTRGDGWPELCGFLGIEPPALPFPKVNDFRSPFLG